jgi:hypothetical protein
MFIKLKTSYNLFMKVFIVFTVYNKLFVYRELIKICGFQFS